MELQESSLASQGFRILPNSEQFTTLLKRQTDLWVLYTSECRIGTPRTLKAFLYSEMAGKVGCW